MSSFGWESFLRQWSQAILESMSEDQLALLPQEAIDSGWLGYPGATEKQISQVEAWLRLKFPPSYREFLKVTNGWRQTTPFIRRLWSTEGIERFAVRHQKWIESFTNHHENSQVSFDQANELDDLWEPVTVADEDYFVYGDEQDCSKLRVEYLRTAIEISDVGESSIYLLNPQVFTEEGEWEAWFFADWLPGADRYPSFRTMMEAEYQNFLELRDTSPERGQKSEQSQPLTTVETEQIARPPEETQAEETQPLVNPIVALPEPSSSESPLPFAAPSSGATLEVWQVLKRLTIEFRTRREGEQTEYRTIASAGETEPPQSWPGLGEPKLRQWLRQQLAEANPSTTATAVIEPPPSAERPNDSATLKLEIDQLRIWQDSRLAAHIMPLQPAQNQAKQMAVGSLTSQQPFSVEIAFKLVGQTFSKLTPTQPITYKAYFYARNRDTGSRVSLGETEAGSLMGGTLSCIAKLAETRLEPGLYRLQVITALQGVAVTPAYFELPSVQVQ